jgi:hypothetical protein
MTHEISTASSFFQNLQKEEETEKSTLLPLLIPLLIEHIVSLEELATMRQTKS